MEQEVIFNGQILTLTRFWATGEPCLWITDPEQIGMPKMEFVGGHPDEYCIFLKNLTETELSQITSLDGAPLDVKEERNAPALQNLGEAGADRAILSHSPPPLCDLPSAENQ